MSLSLVRVLGAIGLVLLCSTSHANAKPFPLNFDLDSLHKAEEDPTPFTGRIIAFNGMVAKMKRVHDNKPYFFVQFHNPNPKKEGIWVAGYVNVTNPEDLVVGHDIAVLAYFSLTDPNDKPVRKIHKLPFHSIGFCIVNVTTKMGIYSPDGQNQCMEWQNGALPIAPADTTGVGLNLQLELKK